MHFVTGDAQIVLCDPHGKGLRTRAIETIWEHWHLGVLDHMPGGNGLKRRRRLLPASRQIHARVYDERSLRPQAGRILEVVRSAPGPVVDLTTAAGRQVRCTEDSRLLTVDGWKRARELTGTDFVLRAGKRATRDQAPVPPMLRRGIGVWTSGLRPQLIAPVDQCYLCKTSLPGERLVLDHVIPVAVDLPRALDVRNLKPACEPCHRVKTNGEQIYAQRLGSVSAAVPDRAAATATAGDEVTYGLSIAGLWRNHLANGLVGGAPPQVAAPAIRPLPQVVPYGGFVAARCA